MLEKPVLSFATGASNGLRYTPHGVHSQAVDCMGMMLLLLLD